MKKIFISTIALLSMAVSCDLSSDRCICDCFGIFVVDSLFASSEIDTCHDGITGLFNNVRIVCHFENLDGVVIESCLSIENTGWGTGCTSCEMPYCLKYVEHKNEMFELYLFNSHCTDTEEEYLNFILKIESVFWKENADIVDTGIQYYNNYVWTDTISVPVKRLE